MLQRISLLLLVIGLVSIGAKGSEAPAHEFIDVFLSQVQVNADSSLDVTETITVVSQGVQIRHGIYRDFPTEYRDELGNVYRVDMKVLQVRRDGQEEPWHSASRENGVRIYIGSKNVLLSPGTYEYTLKYHTTRQLGFFKDHDELYWNVTGNGWVFPIAHANVQVHLPGGVPMDQVHVYAYTGPEGAKGKDYRYSLSDGVVDIGATKPLLAHEGLTISVGFPKGLVTEPTQQQQAEYFLLDNRPVLISIAGFVLVLLYYFLVWMKLGRDPAPGQIALKYLPPPGLSPAAARYLLRMGFDNKALAASVVNLAVHGLLTIRQEEKIFVLERKTDVHPSADLAPEETALLNALFSSKTLRFDKMAYVRVRPAAEALRKSLARAQEKIYFFKNSRYLVPGVILTALTLLAVAWTRSMDQRLMALFMCVWLSIWTFGVLALLGAAYAAWRSYFKTRAVASLLPAVLVSAFAVPFVAGEAFGIAAFSQAVSITAVPVLLGLGLLTPVFYQLLKAPTRAGRDLLDQLEGFKLYLDASQAGREYGASIPQDSPQVFEKFLPWAMALDMETQWAANFTQSLAAAADGGRSSPDYAPIWFIGDHSALGSRGYANFASTFGASFSSAVSSSTSVPGSSSGGGGGGSSGGGGGGGGGGGW